MITDAYLQFSDAQAVTSAAGSTNTIDLGAQRNIGVGENLYVMVSVDVAMTDASSNSTLSVDLEGDSTESFTPDGTQPLFIIPALSAVGSKFYARVIPDFAGQYRYIRLKYTPNNGDLTTGSFTASLVHGIDKFVAYADGITIT
jgi:hypothetical protein